MPHVNYLSRNPINVIYVVLVRNDLLYYKCDVTGEQARFLCYVPKAFRLSLLRILHDEDEHIGVDKTTDLILRQFWFPG